MFGRISALTLATALLTASPALAQTFSQDAPTSYLGQNTAAVLSKGLSYFSAGGTGINYATAMAGGEFGLGINGAFGMPGGLGTGINGNVSYKFPLSRMGGMAAAVALSGTWAGLGGAATTFGRAGIDVPLTMDMGGALLSITPNVRAQALTNPMGTLALGADVGVQYPVAPFWSVLGSVMPSLSLAPGGGITAPIVLGARLSPTSTSHVDFTLMNVTPTGGFGLNAGTLAVTGHIGWR